MVLVYCQKGGLVADVRYVVIVQEVKAVDEGLGPAEGGY